MKTLALLLIAASSVFISWDARAIEAIGGQNYVNTSSTAPYTIISGATNTNGLDIKTLVVVCSGNANISVLPPGAGVTTRYIMACNPTSSSIQGIAMLPSPIYLPPGYSLSFGVGTTSTNQVYMTYDLIAGP